jgi:hypothetical protein
MAGKGKCAIDVEQAMKARCLENEDLEKKMKPRLGGERWG